MKPVSLKRIALDTAIVVSVLFGWALSLLALEVPALRGRVNDYGGMLSSATVRQLETALAQLETTDSTQIAVLTVPSLEGDSLEDFSMRVVEKWQIGQKDVDNGALLLSPRQASDTAVEPARMQLPQSGPPARTLPPVFGRGCPGNAPHDPWDSGTRSRGRCSG